MIDLQIIEIKDILKVNNISPLKNIEPMSVEIEGSDFRNTEYVLINDSRSPSVVILSNTKLLAQIPEGEETRPISSVAVISSRLTKADRSIINICIGNNPKSVDGFERLIQTFLKILFQTPGTDLFAPKSGGGLLGCIGKPIRRPTQSSLVSDFHAAVTRTRQQIISSQANDSTLRLDERLLYAKVVDAQFFTSELTLSGKIQIGNQAGNSNLVNVR
jgi:hypothetical protein